MLQNRLTDKLFMSRVIMIFILILRAIRECNYCEPGIPTKCKPGYLAPLTLTKTLQIPLLLLACRIKVHYPLLKISKLERRMCETGYEFRVK